MAAFLPKAITAILIWFIGKFFLNLGIGLIKKIDIKGFKLDNKAISLLTKVTLPLGKFILILIILDYLGVGRTIIGAFMNGLTLAIAIALGMAFGKGLEKEASNLITKAKKHL